MDLEVLAIEMDDYLRASFGLTDVISPALVNRLIGDNEYDCD